VLLTTFMETDESSIASAEFVYHARRWSSRRCRTGHGGLRDDRARMPITRQKPRGRS